MMTSNRQRNQTPTGLTDWRERKKRKKDHRIKRWGTLKAAAIAAATVLGCLSSQAGYAQSSTISVVKSQTNEAPGWRWSTSEPVDQCQLRIQNKANSLVYEGKLYNTLEFTYTDGIVHNEVYRANVQCSKDSGQTWGYWSGYSAAITVDTVPPRIELNTFKRDQSGYPWLAYATMDDLVGVDRVHVQIARDADFADLVYDERHWGATSTSIYGDLPEGVYYARIAAIDKAGNHSAFSAAKEIYSSNDYAQMSVTALRTFTNQAPEWGWFKIDGFDVYEIEIENLSEGTKYSERVTNNRFTYATRLEHGKQFRARVKGSRDGGDSWEAWTAFSDVITVDTQEPVVKLMAFVKVFEEERPSRKLGAVAKEATQRNAKSSDLPKYWNVNFDAQDNLSGVKAIQVQIAADVNFTHLILDERQEDIYNPYYQFTPDETMLGENYFVRMKVIDAAGNESEFTPPRKLDTVAPDFDFQVNAKEFTNKAPEWSWPLIDGFNHYEVEITKYDNEGNESVFTEPIGNVNHYTYTGGVEHGERYYLSVRGQDESLQWSEWKLANTGTTIDLQTPEISLDSFSYIKYYNYDYTLQVSMNKDSWALESMQVQIARDPQFEQLVYDETRPSYNISNYFTVDAGPLLGAFYARVKVTDKAGNESAFTPARVIYSSSAEDSISNIHVNKRTRDTLEWLWTKPDNMNVFEVQIEDENGTVLHTERLGNVNHFVYHPQNATEEQVFYFMVKGSSDHGVTWGDFSEKDLGVAVVDTVTPPVKLNRFLRENENALQLEHSIDSSEHLVELQIQIATDAQFNHVVYDKTTITYPGNNRWSFIYDENENYPEQQYYARIKVFDFAGNESEYTPAVRMTEDLSVSDFAAFSRTINATPGWWWTQNEKLSNHEVEVLDQNGVLIDQSATGGERYFMLSKPFEHGESFSARVRGESAFNGERGEWSAYSTPIMADLGAPSAQLSSFIHPRANTVEFKYNLADDLSPLGYLKIEVAKEPEFETLVFEKIISATTNPSVYQTPLSEPGDLYARIAVIDAAGNVSPYSDIAKVDTVMTSTPVMYSGASYTKDAPSWSWSDVYNTNAYQIQIQDKDGNVVDTDEPGKVSRYIYEAGHVHGQAFKARVRGRTNNGADWGKWSNLSGLQTVDTEPPVLGIRSFMHTDATTAEIRFTADGTVSGMSEMTIQVAEDAQFNQIVATKYFGRGELNNRSYSFKELPEDKVLYARIMGYDSAGNASEFSPAFKIDSVTAEKPQLRASRYMNQAPQWSWEKLYMATDYEIEITDEEGEVTVINIGNVDHFIYTEGFVHGKTFTAKVHVSLDNKESWSEWSNEQAVTVDIVKPAPELINTEHKEDGYVWVAFKVIEETTGANVNLQIATDAAFTQIVDERNISAQLNQVNSIGVPDMPQDVILYARLKATDYAHNESDYTSAMTVGLSAPRLYWPVSGSTVYVPEIEVKGKTFANAKVQVYVGNEPVGSLILTDAKGEFSTIVALETEGENIITATVQSAVGVSGQSDARKVDYKIPLPVASFVTPSNGSTIAAPILIEVTASDILGIAKVEFYDGDTLLGSVTEAPYQYQWDVGFTDNGTHNLKAVVTNTGGKSVTIEQTVEVDVAPEEVPLPPTEYTGKVENISPAISYGDQTIRISGIAMDRASSAPMANRALKLVLDVSGFKRTINIVSDETGAFSYNFIPQINDKGTYQVFVIHPDEVDATTQGSFNINRISFDINGYKLTAARNFPSQFAVTAKASGDVQGLKWVALPEDQPTGALPQGITINGGNGIGLAEGKPTSMNIMFKADDTAETTGTIILKAFAENTGEMVRGTLQLDYKLVQAQSYLYIPKSSIQTGVQQGDSVSETITLKNNGLLAAQNVRVELQDEHGNKPPSWMFMANTGEIGAVSVGDEVSLQVTAQPDDNVADGVYRFKLHIVADNGPSADAYITVAVTQSGIGGIRFSVADIYTATLDADEQPIPGVAGASIKLQNEAVLTEQYTATTGNDGTALFEDLPPGVYLFRASAPNHTDISGRIRIRPGVVTDQHIFLDYQLINIEFGVTETTINDIYDIVLEAIYQTQVPAPVVLLEPLSINVGGMQAGEERTGQLTLSNYGLIEAQTVKFTPPKTDSEFKYEFFGDIPDTLPPKTRIVIPYRVTALSNKQDRSEAGGDEAGSKNESPIKTLMAPSTRATQCTSYTSRYWVDYEYECINGERRKNGNGGYYSYLKGQHCTGSGINWGTGGGSGGGWGGGGGGWGAPSSMPMTSECIPECPSGLCDTGGMAGNR